MNTKIDFCIIPLGEKETEIIEKLNFAAFTMSTNVFCCSVNLISRLFKKVDSLPIKNGRIAIGNILKFLKWADLEMSLSGATCINIGRKDFEKFFSRNKYNQYIAILRELEIMSIVPYPDGSYFKIGKRNNLFRFYNSYVGDDISIVILDNCTHVSLRIEGRHSIKMINTIKSIEVDYKNAIIAELHNHRIYCHTKNELRHRLSKLFSLNGERFIKYGNKVNRIYHTLSNLSKISRQFLHVNGKRFNDIDIVNCQPLLLCYYLIKNKLPVDQQYLDSCQNGCLYENFYEKTDDEEICKQRRAEAKIELYSGIYFDFKPTNSANKRFKELFPLTYNSLKEISSNEETLASILQNTEAEVFNGLIPKNSKYYFTLFDAIYFTDISDLVQLEHDITHKFLELGIKPQITINKFGED